MPDKSLHIKKALIEALEKSLGIVTTACKIAGYSRQTFYEYYRTDKEFKAQVDDIEYVALDFVESQLQKKIKEGSDTAIIFYLKCKGKKRGYIEKQELDITTGGDKINKMDLSKLSDETLKLIERDLTSGGQGGEQ